MQLRYSSKIMLSFVLLNLLFLRTMCWTSPQSQLMRTGYQLIGVITNWFCWCLFIASSVLIQSVSYFIGVPKKNLAEKHKVAQYSREGPTAHMNMNISENCTCWMIFVFSYRDCMLL